MDALWESDDVAALNRSLDSLHAALLQRVAVEVEESQRCYGEEDAVRHVRQPFDDTSGAGTSGSSSDVPLGTVGTVEKKKDRTDNTNNLVDDPTEAFLAIQAAFLKVVANNASVSEASARSSSASSGSHGARADSENNQHQHQQQQQQRIIRFGMRCLQVVEALAKCVVGPAWHEQLRQQRQRKQRRVRILKQQRMEEIGASASGTPFHHHRYQHSDVTHSLRDNRGSGAGLRDGHDDGLDAGGGNRRRTVSDGSEEWRRHRRGGQLVDEMSLSVGEGARVFADEDNNERIKHRRYPPIPELLPAAMIRFAAYFSSSHFEQADCCNSDERDGPFAITYDALLVSQMAIVRALAIPQLAPDSSDVDDAPSSLSCWQIVGVLTEMRTMVRGWLARSSSRSAVAVSDADQVHGRDDVQLLALVTYRDLLVDGGWRPSPPLMEGQHGSDDDHKDERHDPNAWWCEEAVVAVLAAVGETTGARADSEVTNRLGDVSSRRGRRPWEVSIACLRHMVESMLVPVTLVHDIVAALLPLVPLDATESGGASGALYALLRHETTAVSAMDVLLATMDVVGDGSPSVPPPLVRNSSEVDDARRATTIVSTVLFGNSTGVAAIPMLRIYYDAYLETTFRCLSHCTGQVFSGSSGPAGSESVYDDRIEKFAGNLLAGLTRAILSQCQQLGATYVPLYLSVIEWEWIISSAKACITPWLSLSGGTARHTATEMIRSIGSFLDYSTDHDPAPFVEYDLQQELYLWLLRDSIPPIGDKRTKTAVAVSTVHNWIKYALFPFRLEDWSRTATCILREAFRKTDTAGRASSRYVFDATVRLEAIRGLTRERPKESTGELDVLQSLLVFTQHMRELHLDLIRSSIIPCLREVFVCTSDDEAEDPIVIQTNPSNVVQDPEPKLVAEAFETTVSVSSMSKVAMSELLRYCVQLAGRLYRSVSGDRGLRLLFVEMLQNVALDEGASTNRDHRSQLAEVRIVAVLELSKCLEAAFVSLLHAHESVPNLIMSLCKVLDCVTRSRQTIIDDANSHIEMTVLGVAALDPLTRLRVAIDGKVAFRARQHRANSTSDLLLPFFAEATAEYRSAVVETYGSPCVGIEGLICSSSSATRVSFEGIIDSVVSFLQTKDQLHEVHPRALGFADKCMRIHCFDVLRHQFLASIPVRFSCSVARAVFTSNGCHSDDADVAVAKGLALIRCAENAVILVKCRRSSDAMIHRQDLELVPEVLNLVLELMLSDLSKSKVIARHGVTAILPGLVDLDRTFNTDFSGQILAFVDASLTTAANTWNSSRPTASVALSILSLMHDLFGLQADIADGLLIRLLMFASTVTASGSDSKGSFAVHLAAECAALTIDRLTVEGLNEAYKLLRSDASRNDEVLERLSRQVYLQRIARLGKGQNPGFMKNVLDRDELERLSEESMNVESFQASKTGAWLLDDQVLFTCRLGTPLSQYNGFLEVATRSLAGRHRSLLRIPGCASVYDPEFPSQLRCPWDNASASWPIELPSGSAEQARQGPSTPSIVAAVTEKYNRIMSHDVEHQVPEESNGASSVDEAPGSRNGEADRDEALAYRNDVSFWLDEVLSLGAADRLELEPGILRFLCRVSGSSETQSPALRRLDLDANLERTIGVLDRTPSSSAYKVGFLYDQSARRTNAAPVDMETRLLMTRAGSPGYYRFAHRLGKVVPTKFLRYYSGGLDTSRLESDGPNALVWTDSDAASSTVGSRFIVFHAVDMMPVSSKSTSVSRKRHIGNDYVLILFADRGSDAIVEFDLKGGELICGAFGFVVIWVTMAQPGIFRINVRVRQQPRNDELNDVLSTFVSDNAVAEDEAPTFVRNIAMRADLACRTATGASDAQCNYIYRFHLLRDMARFVKRGDTS